MPAEVGASEVQTELGGWGRPNEAQREVEVMRSSSGRALRRVGSACADLEGGVRGRIGPQPARSRSGRKDYLSLLAVEVAVASELVSGACHQANVILQPAGRRFIRVLVLEYHAQTPVLIDGGVDAGLEIGQVILSPIIYLGEVLE